MVIALKLDRDDIGVSSRDISVNFGSSGNPLNERIGLSSIFKIFLEFELEPGFTALISAVCKTKI
jgi:hypothetical protein